MIDKKISRKDFLKILGGGMFAFLASKILFTDFLNKKYSNDYGSSSYGGKKNEIN